MRLRSPSSAASRLVLLTVLVLAAGCSPTSGALGTPATPQSTAVPSVAQASGDVTPAPTATGQASPAETPGPSIAGSTIVRVYLIAAASGTTADPVIVPVLRGVPRTLAVASAAMSSLLAGPDPKLDAGISLATTIPTGTRLLGIALADGVATVDLSAEYASGGGSASMFARLAQVVYTLTQFPTVASVRFELDGVPVTTFSGEGIVLDHPVGRADFRGQLPAIFVDRPALGAAAGNPARISGVANVFEATFRARLADATGTVLVDQQVSASCGTGCWGDFSASLSYAVATAQWGTLRVYDLSPKDGTPENITEYPVWLTPAG